MPLATLFTGTPHWHTPPSLGTPHPDARGPKPPPIHFLKLQDESLGKGTGFLSAHWILPEIHEGKPIRGAIGWPCTDLSLSKGLCPELPLAGRSTFDSVADFSGRHHGHKRPTHEGNFSFRDIMSSFLEFFFKLGMNLTASILQIVPAPIPWNTK